MTASCEVTNGDATLWTLYSILLDNYIEALQKINKKTKQGPLSKKKKERRKWTLTDHTVTSPFHHKTKQHQTPLIWFGLINTVRQLLVWNWPWNREHCGIRFCLLAREFIGKILFKNKKNNKKKNAFKSIIQFFTPHYLIQLWTFSAQKVKGRENVKELSVF